MTVFTTQDNCEQTVPGAHTVLENITLLNKACKKEGNRQTSRKDLLGWLPSTARWKAGAGLGRGIFPFRSLLMSFLLSSQGGTSEHEDCGELHLLAENKLRTVGAKGVPLSLVLGLEDPKQPVVRTDKRKAGPGLPVYVMGSSGTGQTVGTGGCIYAWSYIIIFSLLVTTVSLKFSMRNNSSNKNAACLANGRGQVCSIFLFAVCSVNSTIFISLSPSNTVPLEMPHKPPLPPLN